MCCRSENQRLEIKEAYFKKFHRDLIQDLKNDLSGYFSKTIQMLMKSRPELNAYYLRKALYSDPINFKVIIEILAEQKMTAIFKANLTYEKSKVMHGVYKKIFSAINPIRILSKAY